MENPKLADLRRKFAEKPWTETFQLVRRCMEKSRNKSILCAPLVQTQKRLQEELNASLNTVKSRLELIAKQQGAGFHTTEMTCYLTIDLFYLEVLLLPRGDVKEVNVAPHGKSPVPSESLLQLLRTENFADFSIKLADLFAQYNIPGNNEIKMKLFASFRHLVEDLEKIAHLPQAAKYRDPQLEMINNGRIGIFIATKEDCPLTIQFYMTPSDGVKTSESNITDLEAVVQAAQVLIAASNGKHKLQTTSVLPQPPQLDPQGFPVILSMDAVPHETFPACFLLKLKPAVPMMLSFVKRLFQITDVAIAEVDLQWAPLRKLLMRGSCAHRETLDEQDAMFTKSFPGGGVHSYILPAASWDAPPQRATMVDSIPFTHPAHVVALLDLLRHQCAINTLLRSCFTSRPARTGSICGLHFEVLPESDTSFSVTFPRPNTDSLAVLLVEVYTAHQITCRLYGAGSTDSSINEYIATVMQSCMSFPRTMWTLYSKLQEITSAPLSVSSPVATDAENEHRAPSSTALTDTSRGLATLSQSTAVSAEDLTVSGAVLVVPVTKSERSPDVNISLDGQPLPKRSCRRAKPENGQ